MAWRCWSCVGARLCLRTTLRVGEEEPHELASGTKSFSGVMAVCAVQDGLLKLDEKVADTLTEWQGDPRKSAVTIRQLLSLSSGIDGGENGSRPSIGGRWKWPRLLPEPGHNFSYGPIPFQIIGEVMKRKLATKGETVEGYLKRGEFLDPIGLKVGASVQGPRGQSQPPVRRVPQPRHPGEPEFPELLHRSGHATGLGGHPPQLVLREPCAAISALIDPVDERTFVIDHNSKLLPVLISWPQRRKQDNDKGERHT